MNRNFRYGYSRMTDIMPVEKAIKPNLPSYVSKLKIFKTLVFLGIIVCFVSFGGLPILLNNISFGVVLIPFFGFGLFGIMSSVIYSKYRVAYAAKMVMDQILNTDKILIENISYTFSYSDNDTLYVIKLLINTGNLDDYEIIDDILVAKKVLNIKSGTAEETERNEENTDNNNQLISGRYCPFCGKGVNEEDRFCKGCGKRL